MVKKWLSPLSTQMCVATMSKFVSRTLHHSATVPQHAATTTHNVANRLQHMAAFLYPNMWLHVILHS